MRIEHLQLFTSMPGELMDFYNHVLECTTSAHPDGFVLHTAQTDLLFSRSGQHAPVYHFACTIPFHKVAEAQSWMAQKVALIDLGEGKHLADFKNWDAKAFYFFDPAGNIVEFIGRQDATAPDLAPFTGRSLLNVSEIGIVTDDVALTCRQLEELWQVPLFHKQTATSSFAACGDDEGLFIVVKEGRHWYPTQLPAASAPMRVRFRTADGYLRQLDLGL